MQRGIQINTRLTALKKTTDFFATTEVLYSVIKENPEPEMLSVTRLIAILCDYSFPLFCMLQ